MKIEPKSQESLLAEFRSEIHQAIPALRASVGGQRFFLEAGIQNQDAFKYSDTWWIHQAHIGTLDKLETLLRRDGEYESFELLAIARNLFENLVWLKLMNNNRRYGIVFYSQLMREQIQNYTLFLSKAEEEANLFDSVDELDDYALMSTIGNIISKNPTKEEIRIANSEHEAQIKQLDDLVRREFILYSGPATFNGYKFQAMLIRKNEIPKQEKMLASIKEELDNLTAAFPTLIDHELIGIATSKWNWFEHARKVGMEKQYRFIYAYTSKLLHSTPLNIATEKSLTPSESIIMLDYIFITAKDLMDQIRGFEYPGQVKAVALDLTNM